MSEHDEPSAETPEDDVPGESRSGDPFEPTAGAESQPLGDRAEVEVTPRNAVEKLDGRVVTYWLLSGSVSLLVMLAIGTGAAVMLWSKIPLEDTLKYSIGFSLAGLMLAWTVIAPPLAYARWRFQITVDLLLARYGIIYHEEKAIPISRLQHVDLTRGPIERMFGLATLVVFTAGTEGASFRLPGLAVARAEELRDQILETRGDDVI